MSLASKIRVLHSLEQVNSGGVEKRRLLLAQRLDPSRFEQRVLCTTATGPLAHEMEAAGVGVVELGPVRSIFDLPRYVRAARLIRAWRPDIVHGAVFEGFMTGVLGARLAGVSHIVVEETSYPTNRSVKGWTLFRLLTSLADHCVAVSPEVGRYLVSQRAVDPQKLTVISNGTERPSVPDVATVHDARAELGLDPDAFVFGSVGRMVPDSNKRFDDLIAALSALREEGCHAQLLLVGDGPDRPRLKDLTLAAGVEDHVAFAGYQRNVGLMYALMDAFALASERESFGLVVAEAMLAGLPVVATRVGGIPNVVSEGITGALVPPFDPRAFAVALSALARDPDLRSQMGAAGRERADRHFSADRYADDVAAFYEQVVAQVSR
ncbi:MAG TPA: glycosyltransferase [Gemmatimonadetes bacterium]|nr:glycosyltransferase [Gemmatimonadota bacterium]